MTTYSKPDDDRIYLLLYHYRMMTLYQLAAFLHRDPDTVAKRIRKLISAGMLAAPDFQQHHPNYTPQDYQPLRQVYDASCPKTGKHGHAQKWLNKNTFPDIFAITRQCADYLKHEYELPVSNTRYDWNNSQYSDYYKLKHTIQIPDCFLYLQHHIANEPGLELTHGPDLTEDPHIKFKVFYKLGLESKTYHHSPDGFYAAERIGYPKRYGFLEKDRGSMPIYRSTLAQSSIARKYRLYDQLAYVRQHKSKMQIDDFDVLFVTTTPKRTRNMIERLETMPEIRNPGRFLHTNTEVLKHASPFEPICYKAFEADPVPLPLMPDEAVPLHIPDLIPEPPEPPDTGLPALEGDWAFA